jgi:hypothetical protein
MKINFIFGKSVGALTGVFLLMSLSASAFGDSQPDCESSSTTSTVIRVVKEKTRRSLGGISELMKANRKEYSDVQQKLEEVISKIKTGEDEYKERGRAMDLIRSDGGKRDKYNRVFRKSCGCFGQL